MNIMKKSKNIVRDGRNTFTLQFIPTSINGIRIKKSQIKKLINGDVIITLK